MQKLFQLILVIILCGLTSTSAQVSNSKWQSEPMKIDGSGTGWGVLPRFFNTDTNLKYEFRNDAQSLYLILKVADRATQIQLLRAGFSVKLKVKSSNPVKAAINFVGSKTPPLSVSAQNKLVDRTMTDAEFMPKDTAMLEGFMFSKGIITSDNKDEKSICFARSKSIKELASYEFRIPLREIFGNEYTMQIAESNPIQLQVIINELSQNEMKKVRSGMHSGGRGMGGMHGGGMGGGRGMGNGRSMGNGDMTGGGEIGGTEIGEAPGGETQNEMQAGMRSGFGMERKSFSIDFKLSSGK